jgi:hypothetical protein
VLGELCRVGVVLRDADHRYVARPQWS